MLNLSRLVRSLPRLSRPGARPLSTNPSPPSILLPFIDNPSCISVGRAWRANELRLKSFEDLHKLWYVLLKEKNMLLSTRHIHRTQKTAMPNPGRLKKVRQSMARLKTVVGQRNLEYKAAKLLENENSVDSEVEASNK